VNHPLDTPEPADDPAPDRRVDAGSVADRPADDTAADPADDHAAAAPDIAPVSPTAPAASRKWGLVLVLAVLILIADQITKVIAVANLTEGGPSPRILGGLVYFSLIRNPGAAFSIGTGMTWILAIVALAVVVVIIRMASKLRSAMWATSLGLILGGALGNLSDRIFRSPGVMRGHVVDFVSVFGPNAEHFPVFNVADSAITIGGVLLVLTAVLGIEFDGTRPRREHRATVASGADRADG
jgi:signal peptidase II